MASNILSISLGALSAAQSGMRATQNNIANVNTTGYRRQVVNYSNSTPYYSGQVQVGAGVNVEGVRRVYDRFLENQAQISQGQFSKYEAYSTYAAQVDTMLGDPNTALNTAISDFFNAVNEVANDPTSLPARQTMLVYGENLATRFNSLNTSLEGMREGLDREMDAITQQVSDLAAAVANLNDQIAVQEGATGQTANELRDMRDQTAAEINKLVNINTFTQADGTYSIYVGSGQPLVIGNRASTMKMVQDPANTQQRVPALDINGTQVTLDTHMVPGGRLGGILAFRDEVLDPTQQDLASLAIGIANSFNTQHKAGFDQDGTAGLDFFSVPTGANDLDYLRRMSVELSDPREIAAASIADGAPGDNTNALALANLQTSLEMNGGTTTFQNYYGQTSNQAASRASSSEASLQAFDLMTQQALEAAQAVSGVNLDEEATNLLRFQQAYQAAARAIQVSTSLFDEILSVVR